MAMSPIIAEVVTGKAIGNPSDTTKAAVATVIHNFRGFQGRLSKVTRRAHPNRVAILAAAAIVPRGERLFKK
jgi:hypothetical protein